MGLIPSALRIRWPPLSFSMDSMVLMSTTKTLLQSMPVMAALRTGSSPLRTSSGRNSHKDVSHWVSLVVVCITFAFQFSEYIITHAPIAPWFSDDTSLYPSGAYHAVAQAVGNSVDWWHLQYYNQGSDYDDCTSLLTTSQSNYPHTSIFEINQYSGVPLNNLVLGKPASTADADSGYLDPNTLAGCLTQGQSAGWSGGAMFWEYPDASSEFVQTVRSQAFPV